MREDRDFNLKKAQAEDFFRSALKKSFPRPGKRVSLRRRRRFIEKVTREIGARFGKELTCLIDFENGEWTSVIAPARVCSTDKGRIYQSFAHERVFYTSHCVERFSERTGADTNCIIALDGYLAEALSTYGADKEYLIGPAGVFAYDTDADKLIVKTFINYELLSDEQIRRFYRPDVVALFAGGMVADDPSHSDFVLMDEMPTGQRPR
jgi:hypothetical protein